MSKHLLKFSFLLLLMFHHSLLQAQQTEMADRMRADGKIYVVIVIAFFVLAVMSIYLIGIDRRLRRMEKQQNEGK